MSGTDVDGDLVDLIGPVRRYVSARVRSRHDAEDVVQETFVRVMEARRRLSPDSAVAYALVVARHVIADQAAAADRARRNRHRMIDLSEPERPDDRMLRSEEQVALREALAEVPPAHREALLAHVLGGDQLKGAAQEAGASSGSAAAQLARVRARLRLDYVLALRGVELPTQRCRPVLLALSAADSRRQDALRAGHHLLACPTCSSVSEPLLERRSALAAILPWFGAGAAIELIRRFGRQGPRSATATAAGAATLGAVALAGVVYARPEAPAPPPAATASSRPAVSAGPATPSPPAGSLVRTSDGAPVLPVAAALATMAGDTVQARGVPVVAVGADEGFWVGDAANGRVWVQLVRTGQESGPTVRAGQTVSFTGRVTEHDSGFAARSGVGAAEGAALLTRQSAHVDVDERALRIGA